MALVKAAPPTRLAVLSRVLAGLAGGYALASAAAWGLTAVLPGPRVEASTAAGLMAYVIFVTAALWSFVPRRGITAWSGIAGAIALFLVLGWAAP